MKVATKTAGKQPSWQSVSLACARPCVQFPACKTHQPKETQRMETEKKLREKGRITDPLCGKDLWFPRRTSV